MSAAVIVSFRKPVLPWAHCAEDELRFARVRNAVLLASALLCVAALLTPVLTPDHPPPPDVPARLASVVLESVKLPPRVPTGQPAAKPEPLAALPRPAQPARKVALNKQAPVPQARVPVPNRAPGEVDAARRKAAGVGLLAMSRDLAELQGAPLAVQLAPVKQGPGVGTGVGVGVGAGTAAGIPTRALITSNASSGSGGINTAAFSNNAGGGGLAGRATTVVEGALAGGGSGGPGGGGARGRADGTGSGVAHAGNSAGGRLQNGGSGKASRSIEEIKLVFERNKGAIYAIYNRALREEPGLQGKVVLELKIAPAGNVVECRIVSSELKTPELEAKLLARIRQFDFSAKDVDLMVVTWPVDFLPS